jgi:hypothetical protein
LAQGLFVVKKSFRPNKRQVLDGSPLYFIPAGEPGGVKRESEKLLGAGEWTKLLWMHAGFIAGNVLLPVKNPTTPLNIAKMIYTSNELIRMVPPAGSMLLHPIVVPVL